MGMASRGQTPEEEAREEIDRLLEAAGWSIQDYRAINLGSSLGVAVREFPLKTGAADYLLFLDRKAVGVIEAKPVGIPLGGVDVQSEKYLTGLPDTIPHAQLPLPFAYESTGSETLFRDTRDPDARSRRVFAFHKPETLAEHLRQPETLRGRLKHIAPLIEAGLWGCQIEAITNLERSLADSRPRALIQMATGSGKTFTSVNFIYRLIKHADARRVLFLVDRNNLGKQTLREFQQFVTPDDGRKFTELYNVQRMTSNQLDTVSRVCITTIQRIFSMLKGVPELPEELEEVSGFEAMADVEPVQVEYNPAIPIETFDFIVTDECHRSIYNLWRQVLEYFDAHLIGLTATPSRQTIGFFDQNLVMEYDHERAVADGVNVDFEVYRIKTAITEAGGKVDAGLFIDKRDKQTRAVRWEQLDEELNYTAKQLDRAVVAKDQIRTVIRTFRDKLFTEIFPGRTEVPKTLIFAKDDSHAEDILHIVREEFGKGNEFCKKITYKTTGEKPEDLIASFRNRYNPRIAVTVDMISTGTDIRPLECLLFMRDIRSRVYFEQMKGRGTRTASPTEFQSVTPDATHKTHFIIVDAVGVCESAKSDSKPLEKKPGVSFEKLLHSVAMGVRDDDSLSSLASRLARLDRELDESGAERIKAASGGQPLRGIIATLFDALDPDLRLQTARDAHATGTPSPEQITQAVDELKAQACLPFDNPKLRDALIEIKKSNEQDIDTVSRDTVLFAGADEQARDKARAMVEGFRAFIEAHKDELTALQIIFSKPHRDRHLTEQSIRELAEAIKRPPLNLTPERLWEAYARLEKSRVRGTPERILADIISLIRFTIGEDEILEHYPEKVEHRYSAWLAENQIRGRAFSPEQMQWLGMIKDHIASALRIEADDLELAPFHDRGGPIKAYNLFGDELNKILDELNEVLAA
jgi:type I restriction enzyme R subunit